MTLGMSLLALLVGCGSELDSRNVTDTDGFEEETDEDPPVIEHDAITETQTFGEDVAISATVTDADSGVVLVLLYYKNEIDGASAWTSVPIITTGDGVYTGTIPGGDMNGGGMDYYIEARDRAGNTAFAPDDAGDDPYHFRIAE